MKTIFTKFLIGLLSIAPIFMRAQDSIDIATVQLSFVPVSGGDNVEVSASISNDTLRPSGPIELLESTQYNLSITLVSNDVDITDVIRDNSTNYQFFFEFDGEYIHSPSGHGNTLHSGDINYLDMDANNLPIGLNTGWETDCVGGHDHDHDHDDEEGDHDDKHAHELEDQFKIVLVEFNDNKTDSSKVEDGTVLFDVTWELHVEEDENAPPCENEEEVITDVLLTFTPRDGGDIITATAQDPDGIGPLDLEVQNSIDLIPGVAYDLAITISNSVADEDITEEIQEEGDEHQFFFAWTEGLFSSPSGDGNIDNASDPVDYMDMDEDGLPIGLATSWMTSPDASGTFRVLLKHQPSGIKTSSSTSEDGGTDLDITWNVNITTSTVRIGADETLAIAPNPVHNNLYVDVKKDFDGISDAQLFIYNTLGQLVHTESINSGTRSSIDMSHLSTGSYLISINTAHKRWVSTLLKR